VGEAVVKFVDTVRKMWSFCSWEQFCRPYHYSK